MRLFVAILLDDGVRSALQRLEDRLKPSCEGVRWISAELLHLTMKFLGEVADRDVAGVAEAVARCAHEAAPFDMAIAGCGTFPAGGAVRIVWAGVRQESGALLRCAEAVERNLEPLGFPPERRPYSAHITIGRVRIDRSGGRLRSTVARNTLDPVEQSVSSITLMSSVLSPSGPTYTAVSTAKLGRADDRQTGD